MSKLTSTHKVSDFDIRLSLSYTEFHFHSLFPALRNSSYLGHFPESIDGGSREFSHVGQTVSFTEQSEFLCILVSHLLVGLPVSFLTSDHTTTGPVVVVAAIIRDEEGRIFATQRGYGDFNDFWEFPGGKIEADESADQALRREIWEELQTRIVVERLFRTVEYDYPQFHLSMQCFLCRIESGHPVLLEHEAARWLSPAELDSVEWLPADR